MIPLELTLEGLFSYRTRQRVDFRPLVEAGLFGILGPTGSGKSALVEAILLALYGKSPRSEGKSIAPIVNRHCCAVSVEFLFQLDSTAGAEQYRCLYQARMLPAGKLHRYQHRIFRWQHGGWQPLSDNPADFVTEALGLDYDNFCRAILLPQGQFHEFLELSPADRASALQRLFQLHRYDVASTVRELARETRARLELLDQQRHLLHEHASEERLRELQQLYEQARSQHAELSEQLREAEAAEARLAELARQWEQYQQLQRELHELRQCEPELAQRRSYLQQLLQAAERLSPLWERLQQLHHERTASAERLRQLQSTYDDAIRQREALLPRYEQLRALLAQRHEDAERERLYKQALRYHELSSQRQRLEERLCNGEELLAECAQQVSQLRQRLEACRQRRERLAEELRHLSILPELTQWYEYARSLRAQQNDVLSELQRLEEQERELLQHLHARAGQLPESYRPSGDSLATFATALREAEDRLSATLLLLQHELDTLTRLQAAAELARTLAPGTPCPVCGSPHHPAPQPPDPTAEARCEELRQQLTELQQALELLRQLATELHTELRPLNRRRQDLQQRLRTLEQLERNHRQLFRWEGYSPGHPEQLEHARQRYAELQAELQACTSEEHELQKELDTLAQRDHQYRHHCDRLAAEYNAIAGQCELLRREVPEELLQLSPEELTSALHTLQQQRHAVEQEYPAVEAKYNELSEALHRYSAEYELRAAHLSDLNTQCDQLQQRFVAECAAFGLSAEMVQEALQKRADIAAELERIRDIEARQRTIAAHCAALEPAALQYDPTHHEELRSTVQRLRHELHELHERLGRLREQLSTAERLLQERRRVEHEHAALLSRSQRLAVLEELFRGNAFIAFVAHTFLQSLCQAANLYFRQWTNGALELDVGDRARIVVRDFLHGGVMRPVQTLSGGQLFQASLAMALALSDMVRASARLRRCLFFIDEGFGNLDRESLLIVMDTLRHLRQQGRLVGIISHREELHHELDAYIRIRSHPRHGSLVQSSWSEDADPLHLPVGTDPH